MMQDLIGSHYEVSDVCQLVIQGSQVTLVDEHHQCDIDHHQHYRHHHHRYQFH